MGIAVDQQVDPTGGDGDRLAGGRAPAERDPVTRGLLHREPVLEHRPHDRGADVVARAARQDPVDPLADGRDAVARAGAEAARVEEGEIVLRVSDGQHVVRREVQEAQDLLDPGALGHAGGQEHEGRTVRDQVPAHVGRAQRLAHRRLVGAPGADDDAADLVVDAPPLELAEQPPGHRGPLVADHRRAGIVDHRAVLGHHAVEELEAVAHARELEEGAPGHEHEPKARPPRPLERGAHRRADPVVDGERAVEIASERLEEHVSGTGAILVPRRPDRKPP